MGIESYLGAIFVLALVIFVHELGHFLVAKWCDVEVRVFSIGFGRTLFSKTIGETDYRIAIVPLGGYVRMAGQDDGEDEQPLDPARGFSAKPLGQRTAIVAAGPAVNIVFAFVIFLVTLVAYGSYSASPLARVGSVVAGTPAEAAGLVEGDLIVEVGETEIASWDQFATLVRASGGEALELQVKSRDGEVRSVVITPERSEQRDAFGEVTGKAYMIGIQRGVEQESVGFFTAIALAGKATWGYSAMIFQTLGRVLFGNVPASDLGGPIEIVRQAGRMAASGLEPLLRFMAIISINLGIINVLPIPVLDGGHLFFFLIEGLRGRPLSVRFREMAQQVGVVLLVALMVFVVINDISRIVSG